MHFLVFTFSIFSNLHICSTSDARPGQPTASCSRYTLVLSQSLPSGLGNAGCF